MLNFVGERQLIDATLLANECVGLRLGDRQLWVVYKLDLKKHCNQVIVDSINDRIWLKVDKLESIVYPQLNS